MRKILLQLALFGLLGLGLCSCEKEVDVLSCPSCEMWRSYSQNLAKDIKKETAHVRKMCVSIQHFEQREEGWYSDGGISADTFVLVLDHHIEGVALETVFPCNAIPPKYQKDGLAVKVSGAVLLNAGVGGCEQSPTANYAGMNVFEIQTIQIINR